MRLIDADKLIEKLRDFKEWENDDGRPIHTMSETQRIDRCINFAQTEPTAYDIDKVVEELNKLDVKSITRYKNGNFGNFDGVEYYIKKRKAIEIVKQGGVGTETETIRDKAVKWNNNSSKRVPYEFIDYVEGKREIGVSDDVCEWKVKSNYYVTKCSHDTDVMYGLKQDFKYCPYCGKKIKVVE